ncbi:hypothetical protein Ae201684_006593 [Aphanomyces euteiches]|uniref:TFIID subunit TAF5 NTD2 domain-containing protein n=1 Tax=Aphanomyces euteiches TaxID=100861 RepID=A0A6G0XBE1_9STRA|nr:hypothetical protein Ae201684_006593 [Aphanomyces euteiches]KAH9142790.1 hypothetical protein AeRB84_013157 [Aphanomyces euteiches]
MMNLKMDDLVASYLAQRGFQTGTGSTPRAPSGLHEYARHIGLSIDACVSNHVLFHGMHKGDPEAYENAYSQLLAWIGNALDMYKLELHAVAFPLFVHCYLDLVGKGHTEAAKSFFQIHAKDHQRLHKIEIRSLGCVLTREQLTLNEYAKQVLHSKFHVRLSMLSFQLLHTFLRDHQMFLLLCILNDRVSISVETNHPSLTIAQCDSSLPSALIEEDESPLFESSDEISQRVEHTPDDNHVAAQVTSGDYDIGHMIQATGKDFSDSQPTLDTLHRVPILWGVLPPRKRVVATDDADGENGDGPAGLDAPGASSTSAAAGNGSSSIDKPKDTDADDALEAVAGPVPDRSSTYNANILEKLVLRLPADVQEANLQHAEARLALSSTQLPSALCYTVANASGHLNNVCFSTTGEVVGGAFDDASFRVWRQDGGPLGGFAHHKDPSSAVLRGHSGPVYGCAFTPDNRFALTSSADSTIRLWSLASRTNMVCYRAHNYPVWDVTFSSLGYYFASASMDRTARLWSTDRVQPLRIFAGHLGDVECVAFHPNHNYIATGSTDKTVRIWNVQSGACIRVFSAHYGGVSAVAFSPNGRYLASGGDDAFVNIWDLHMNKRIETLVGHTDAVHSVAFSGESSIVCSGGADHTVRLWDMQRLDQSTRSGAPVTVKPAKRKTSVTPSHAHLKTFTTKRTPAVRVQFTPRNLLLVGGAFVPP